MEPTTLLSSPGALLMVMFMVVALGFYLQRFKWVKPLGPALTVIIIGIILSNLKIVPVSDPTYDALTTYCVPLSVSICLLSLDLKQMRKLTKEPLIALASAVISVCFAAFVFGLFFADKVPEGWKVAGMFVGTYTGGSSNLTAIAVGLDAAKETIAAANAADYVVGIPSLILYFAMPAIYASSKLLKKFWPYHFTEAELAGGDDEEELMAAKEWSIQEIAWLLGIGFLIVWVATTISGMIFGEGFRSAGRILLITTFSIIAAQIPFVQRLRGNFDLGLYVALLFLVTIGFAVDLKQFFGSTFYITLFCFCVIAVSTLLHLFITRLFKVRFEYILLSIVGCISDGPTAALVASSAKWKSIINIGLLMGVLAGALGNYVGISVAYAIKAVLGF
ncbi:MAG: DUF819 family protein [Eubacteriales bacterium]|nr:DUF819 family protein [Eubacteriales bacterium]